MLTGVASVFAIGKATLALTVTELTDIVRATAALAGQAYFEFKWGVETGVYPNTGKSDGMFLDIPAASEALFVRVRGVDAGGNKGEWSDEATETLAIYDIENFGFNEQTGMATIDSVAHTVSVEVANGTSLAALVALFEVSEGAIVKIGADLQVTEVTANDFTAPVVYTLGAQNDPTKTQDWTITVTVAE